MLQYRSLEEIINHPGLRIVLVKGMPSPLGQAAKTIFEIKHLDYVAAPWRPGEANEAIVAWGGENSAPIVAWAKPGLDADDGSARTRRCNRFDSLALALFRLG